MDDRSEPVQQIVQIVERLQADPSCEDDFRRLFDLYYSRVYHFFVRRGFPPADCLDLTQETFLGIYRGIGGFRREARFETWLFKIAANAYRKRLRWGTAGKREATEVPLAAGEPATDGRRQDEVPASTPAAGDEMLRKERSRLLRRAIDGLPEQMRRCLRLRVDQELTYRQIAVLLRLSPETVKVHLAQARRRLRAELGPYFDQSLAGDGDEAVS